MPDNSSDNVIQYDIHAGITFAFPAGGRLKGSKKKSSTEALADCLASLSDMANTGVDPSASQDIPGLIASLDIQRAGHQRFTNFCVESKAPGYSW